MPITINEEECVGCGTCAEVCEEGAITVNDVAKVDSEKCTDCGKCVDECPNECIKLE